MYLFDSWYDKAAGSPNRATEAIRMINEYMTYMINAVSIVCVLPHFVCLVGLN